MRDISDSHKSTASYTAQTELSTVFAGNSSCVLSPEQIEGPYCEPVQSPPCPWHRIVALVLIPS